VGLPVPWRETIASIAVITALYTAGVAQPVLDLYGGNPELFAAAKLTDRQILEFTVVVALVCPLGWAAVALVLRRWSPAFRAWRVAGVLVGATTVAALLLARIDPPTAVWGAGAVAGAVAVTWLVERSGNVRLALALLGLLCPLTIGLFWLASPEARARSGVGAARKIAIPHTPPIVWLLMDEANLPMLMTKEGAFDGSRYPNLAALAGTSTWYRNAMSMNTNTTQAVPAQLSGLLQASNDWRPFLSDYPTNLFTVLGGTYKVSAYQPVTDICPPSICPPDGTAAHFGSVLQDARIVWEHAVAPDAVDARLPSIDNSWGRFNLPPPSADATHAKVDELIARDVQQAYTGPLQQLAVIGSWAASFRAGGHPELWFAHVLLPHKPWNLLPDGAGYAAHEVFGPDGTGHGGPVGWTARVMAARYALQAGAADREIGVVVDRLRTAGILDQAIVIVSADHGVNLSENAPRRGITPSGGVDESWRVPLLIKAPGQTAGIVDDDPVLTSDVLPTLLGLLGVDASRVLGAADHGVDLAKGVAAGRPRNGCEPTSCHALPTAVGGLMTTRVSYDRYFRNDRSGWDGIVEDGGDPAVLGHPVPAAVQTTSATWRLAEPTRLPGLPSSLASVRLDLTGPAPADGTTIIALDGVAAGWLGGATPVSGGSEVLGIVDYRRYHGPATKVEVYHLERGAWSRYAPGA
jgi:hypothetical protein